MILLMSGRARGGEKIKASVQGIFFEINFCVNFVVKTLVSFGGMCYNIVKRKNLCVEYTSFTKKG